MTYTPYTPYQNGAPSKTLQWLEDQKEKRTKGIDNELDHAEIIAAYHGFKNRWLTVVKKNPKLFKGIIERTKKYDWSAIQAAYKAEKLLQGMPF